MNDYPDHITPNGTLHCVAPGCSRITAHEHAIVAAGQDDPTPPEPRFAVHETDLCNWHHAQFSRLLKQLAQLAPAVREASYAKLRKVDASGKVDTSGISDVGTDWNPLASAVRAELTEWTQYLVRTVLRERPAPKAMKGDIASWSIHPDMATELALAVLQKHHARWLSGYPTLGPDWLQDAIDLVTRSGDTLDAPHVRRITLREQYCQHPDQMQDGTDTVCGAPLAAILRPQDGRRPSEIVCTRDPTHPQILREDWMDHAG